MPNKGLYVPHISNKSHKIRVFRDVNSFSLSFFFAGFILSYAFIKPTNLLIMVLFLLPMCLNCEHNCIVTKINIQLNPLCPKPVSCIEKSKISHMGVRIPWHLIGSAYCHCPQTLSDRKQHEWANDEAAALSLCSVLKHKQTQCTEPLELFYPSKSLAILQCGLVLNICNYLGLCRWD